ncbi:unnamed protein product [Calypogeia fissa]
MSPPRRRSCLVARLGVFLGPSWIVLEPLDCEPPLSTPFSAPDSAPYGPMLAHPSSAFCWTALLVYGGLASVLLGASLLVAPLWCPFIVSGPPLAFNSAWADLAVLVGPLRSLPSLFALGGILGPAALSILGRASFFGVASPACGSCNDGPAFGGS